MNTATTYKAVTAHDWIEASQQDDRIDANPRISRLKNTSTD